MVKLYSDNVLVADIGGTNARFALAQKINATIEIKAVQVFQSVNFETLKDAIHAYLQLIDETPKAACFAVAGPIDQDEITFTNSHWRFNVREIGAQLGLSSTAIINDFEALSAGIKFLPHKSTIQLKEGVADRSAPCLVLGPGTGFGQGVVLQNMDGPGVISTEGGHVGFSPHTDKEIEIFKFLKKEYGRVSIERVLSGMGLVNIYRALSEITGHKPIFIEPSEVTTAAQAGEDARAIDTIDVFCGILGSVTGDAVLSTGARGGVFIGGGIVPRILSFLQNSTFVERFLEKGRMGSYLTPIPVHAITVQNIALRGAAAMII